MIITKTVLCYPDMDRIIVDKQEHLEKYNMAKVSSIDVTLTVTPEEFEKLRAGILVSIPLPR